MADRYWVGGTATWDGTAGTKWATSSGGTGGASVPTSVDDVFFTDLSTGLCAITTGNTGAKSIDCTGFTGTLSGTNAISVAGSITLDAGMGYTYTGVLTLTGTGTLTTAGKTLGAVTINGVGITVTLGDDLTTGNTRTITLTNGTFDANNKNVTIGFFSSSNLNVRTLTMGSGLWTLSGGGGIWNLSAVTNLTFNVNTANIVLSNTSTSARTFIAGGGLTYNTITIGGTTGTSVTTFSGAGAVIGTLASTKTVAHTITFAANLTINNWTVTGTAGNVVTVNSSVVGSQRTLTYTGSGISMDYMSIRDISFAYTLDASNPYLVYAGANSTNDGNNNGIAFIDGTTQRAYRLTTGTTWTVPADWNNSNNTIYMIGAGGGGGNSIASGNNRAAGGGGGGGGYTVLTNQTLTSTVPYTIGTSAGNANGGDTTFNTTNTAGGGLRGDSSTTPTSSGGAGGTGTFAGGTGGAGAFGTVALTNYGSGGGGGAGGVNGVGGNGGDGFGSITQAQVAGGGGGGNGGGSNGTNATSAQGGNGGNNFNGVGGGAGSTTTNGTAGTLGGGGGGGANIGAGGSGGSGFDILNTIGGSGGRGGATSSSASNLGLYGGGGAGAGARVGTTTAGGGGSQGVIFIVYTPSGAPVSNSNFFLMFM
jgi:hypothetical protein